MSREASESLRSVFKRVFSALKSLKDVIQDMEKGNVKRGSPSSQVKTEDSTKEKGQRLIPKPAF